MNEENITISSNKQLVKQDYLSILENNEENALDEAKTHWLLGEWEKLVELDIKQFSQHSERGRFALLIATAYQQLGNQDKARKYTRLALEWGCSHKLVMQVLIAGVFNTLGRAAILAKDESRIKKYFINSIKLEDNVKNIETAAERRLSTELMELGLYENTIKNKQQIIRELNYIARPSEINKKLKELDRDLSKIYYQLESSYKKDFSENQLGLQNTIYLHVNKWLLQLFSDFISEGSSYYKYDVTEFLSKIKNFEKTLTHQENSILSLDLEVINDITSFSKQITSNFNLINISDFFPSIKKHSLIFKDVIFFHKIEVMANTYLAMGDFYQSISIYNELADADNLNKIAAIANTSGATWLLLYYNQEAFFSALDACLDISEIVSFIENESTANLKCKTFLILGIAHYYHYKHNNMKAVHYYSLAIKLANKNYWLVKSCVENLLLLNQHNHAEEIITTELVNLLDISEYEKYRFLDLFQRTQKKEFNIQEHGHVLLMKFLKNQITSIHKQAGDKKLVLIEIGTTRELVNGQGSTEKLAKFCNDNNIHFISVDMDSANTDTAKPFIHKINPEFELITQKGEEFLESYSEKVDFIFLDAYDFDHGGHSEDRQIRYEKVLGERINDDACHKMHLDCTTALVSKLNPWGVICFDDVWFKDFEWQGKGKNAIPFLIKNSFTVVQTGNNAAILVRSDEN